MAKPAALLTDLIAQAGSGDTAALRSVFDSTYDDLRIQRGGVLLDTKRAS